MSQVQDVVEAKKKEKLKWDDKLVGTFLKICVEEIHAGNRPTTSFNRIGWKNLLHKFKQAIGTNLEYKQAKNKWDNLKKEWQVWQTLVGNDTGIGWDPLKKIVQASDEWWEKKLKEVPDAKKFKEHGLPFAEEMEICFMGVVATGENAWAPSSGHLPSSSRGEEVGSGWTEDNISADYTNSLNVDGESTMREEIREDDLDDVSAINKEKKRKLASSSRGSKKKGASRIDDYLQRICGAMESRSRKTVSIEDVMTEISKFSGFGPDSDLLYVSTRLMIHQHYREMFMALKDPACQQSWLRSFHKDNSENKSWP